MIPRPQFSLRALLAWVSLLAVWFAAMRCLAIGHVPFSTQFVFTAVAGAIYGAAIILLAKNQ